MSQTLKGFIAIFAMLICGLLLLAINGFENEFKNSADTDVVTKSDSAHVKKCDILQAIPLAHSQYVIVSYKDSATHKVVNIVADSAATVAFIKSLHVLSVPMDTLYVIKEVPAGQKKRNDIFIVERRNLGWLIFAWGIKWRK